jgi:uncharacterized protein
MRNLHRTLVFMLVWCVSALSFAQPQSVIADPAHNREFPPTLVPLTFSSHGFELDGLLYTASGPGPHGTVLLLHGLPGYEVNGDLAQSIRRAGWNVLMFHYRGTWGAHGKFSQAAAIEDTAEAVRFLRDPQTAAMYRADAKQIVVVGHSFGGFLAGYEASHDPHIKAVAMISATNLGSVNSDLKQRDIRLKRWQTQLHPVKGGKAEELFAEAERHANEWNYVAWADRLQRLPLLLVEADDQNHSDMATLAAALRQRKTAVTVAEIHSDHNFSDSRVALQDVVVSWLHKLEGP